MADAPKTKPIPGPSGKRNRYPDEFRASAILMLEAAGGVAQRGALTRVAGQLGIPPATLSRWWRVTNAPLPAEVVTEKRFDLVKAIEAELEAIFAEMGMARPDANYGQLATAVGILTDKRQILTGGATDNIALAIRQTAVEVMRPEALPAPNGRVNGHADDD